MSDRILEGKVALVTGVTSGLGVGVARVFCQAGCHVVGLARRTDRGEALEKELREEGGDFRFRTCDVTKESELEAVVQELLADKGRIDILINNAGVGGPVKPVETISQAEWEEVIATNLSAIFTLCRLVLPTMQKQQDGVILNIASINAVLGVKFMTPYNAAKAGLVHFTNTMAVENVPHNVRANAIILGGVRSEMSDDVSQRMGKAIRGPDWEQSPETAASRAEHSMVPEEAAWSLAVLCMDKARLITGAAIALDRGMSAGGAASDAILGHSAELILPPP